MVQNKQQLLAKYEAIFDGPMRCTLKVLRPDDVWGNYRGFTVGAGLIWWDRLIPKPASKAALSDITKYPFKVYSVNHGGMPPKGCELK